jgi:hypothetical protein
MQGETMVRAAIAACALVATMSGAVVAASKDVQYGKAPAWVIPPPSVTSTTSPAGAPLRVEYQDFQIRSGTDGEEIYSAWRLRVLKPEGLAVGNVSLTWNPEAGDATVHHLRVLREGATVDVLAGTPFEVLRREGFLENAALNGHLTAVLQVPGLQVGDVLEFAATVRQKDLTLGDHSFGGAQLPINGVPGAFRARLLWPAARRLTWRAPGAVPALQETLRDGQKEVIYELRDPDGVILPAGAPERFSRHRFLEYSDFGSWRELAARLWPLYEKASALPSTSALRAEISRIAAASSDPARRAEAALQLVQERIRYVYVGLDGGNFRPATIEDTWARRFGDCKAKTALLLSVLRELGIEAEPVLVNARGGDGTDQLLPSPAVFDHVLVRVRIGSAVHWLDGTRSGDKVLDALFPPSYRWALPLRAGGADLEAVPATKPRAPYAITVLDIDARKGFEPRVPVKADLILRGDEASVIRTALAGMSSTDAERAIRTYMDQRERWIESDTASWRFDERTAALRLSVVGTGKIEWEGDDERGRTLDINGAGFSPPAEYRRPKEQDQAAPWAVEFPAYRCWATAIHLPPPSDKWQWDYRAAPVDRMMGGVFYWRTADLRDGTMRTVMSKRVDVPEISAAEAQEVNRLLPAFDNKISRVFQLGVDRRPAAHVQLAAPPFDDGTDWMSQVTPCGGGARP